MDQQLTDDFGWRANAVVAALTFIPSAVTYGEAPVRTLVAVLAHADDEAPVAPILA
jgi:hypothetical protein